MYDAGCYGRLLFGIDAGDFFITFAAVCSAEIILVADWLFRKNPPPLSSIMQLINIL